MKKPILNLTKDIQLPNEKMQKILAENYYQKNMDNIDVDINHLENVFTDETYYLAMKIVPLLERKVANNALEFVDLEHELNNPFALLSAKDISKDLHIGINQAYDLLKQDDFPTITIGKRKVVTIAAYLLWKMNQKGGK